MANRKGVGKGKGSGWKNLLASDSYRHKLSAKGIKTAVSLNKSQRESVKRKLLPLLNTQTISGYNLVENPRIKGRRRYRLVYGHDDIKHRDLILEELRRRNLDYYLVPRESKFLDDPTFIKSTGQTRKGKLVRSKEYQLVIDASRKELEDLEEFFRRSAVNYDEAVFVTEGLFNPFDSVIARFPLPGSYTTPDLRIRKRKRFPRFKRADKIIKKLDKNTDLVILSVRPDDTKQVMDALVGEQRKDILIQDYRPRKHSMYEYIKKKTR